MRRSANNGISDDSRLPSLDDDLDTLLTKAEAIFKQKKMFKTSGSTPVTAPQAPPAPPPVQPVPTPTRPPGLMQRQRRP